MNPKIARFLNEQTPVTPCLVVDIDQVTFRYKQLHSALPAAKIYYAVKANPAPAILKKLAQVGSYFDAASWEEIQLCLEAGADSSRISYGNTIKKASSIAKAYEAGVSLFVFDCIEELEKIAHNAPKSKVYCRLMVENKGADWPLSRKFGTSVENAYNLMHKARELGLTPYGLSFHVGSQQTSPVAYETAIEKLGGLFKKLAADDIKLSMVNLGGGFPIRYRDDVPEIDKFVFAIQSALTKQFGNALPEILLEPGRFIVGDSGVVCTEIVLVSTRGNQDNIRWVYLDIGRFGGLAETEGEAIKYPICTPYDGGAAGPVAIAGPTCDGADIMYEKTSYELPMALSAGDRITLMATGAYVASYCATKFNGFAPLEEHYI